MARLAADGGEAALVLLAGWVMSPLGDVTQRAAGEPRDG